MISHILYYFLLLFNGTSEQNKLDSEAVLI